MTTNPDVPVSIDYTSRDYYSLRNQLITRINSKIVEWTGQDPADFGVALVEAFAYVGDIVAYYIDRVANEGYLLTATQRQSLLDIAAQYGYTPTGYQEAVTTLQLNNSSASDVTLPDGSQVAGEVVTGDVTSQVIFTTMYDVVVPATGTNTVTASHGENVALRSGNEADPGNPGDVAGELLGVSDGSPQQQFVLSENQVVDGSVNVYVQAGSTYQKWTSVQHIADYGAQDSVFYTVTDADNYVYVVFGDGISGAIPPHSSAIKAQYVVGGGISGNVPANTLTTLLKAPGLTLSQTAALADVLTVTNTSVGVGGADPESDLEIRINAPKALAANNRAVTLDDFSNIALSVRGVGKAKAQANVWSSVNLYVAPTRNATDGELYPLYDDTNTTFDPLGQWSTLQSSVSSALSTRTQIGVSVTVSPPTYVKSALAITYSLYPGAVDSQVHANILSAVTTAYSYYYADFGAVITPEEIESLIRGLTGVYNARVTALYRLSGTSGRTPLVGAPNEIFVFEESSISLTLASSDATLSGISPSVGTLSPTFSSAVTSYNVTGSMSGVTSIVFTFTKGNANSTIYVNGGVVSGTTYTATIASGTNTFNVSVLAQDNYTSKSYTITVVK